MSKHHNRDEWLYDIEARQRNVVFSDTPANEARFWRNLYEGKQKLTRTRHSLGLLAVLCFLLSGSTFSIAGTFPRLLPPASDFRLSLREDPHSTLPLTASCEGEAGQTLTCRAFVLTLENLSQHTIRLSGHTCREPEVRIDGQIPNSTSGWWAVSSPIPGPCPRLNWTNTRLRPHESTKFETRLISPRREREGSLLPGSYTLRAVWVLFGCTEEPDGTDCLTPLQDTSNPNSVAKVGIQESVEVVSNEVRAESPTLPNLGAMKFSFDANVIPASLAAKLAPDLRAKCAAERAGSIECTAFHYRIGNSGARAVRWMLGCGDFFPEYLADGQWRPVFPNLTCTVNIPVETPILPGSVVEGDFSLAWGYDISPFRSPGEYTFRLVLSPRACFASPDGRFCLTMPHNEPPIASSEVTVRTQ